LLRKDTEDKKVMGWSSAIPIRAQRATPWYAASLLRGGIKNAVGRSPIY
jgi:hypothetical protein